MRGLWRDVRGVLALMRLERRRRRGLPPSEVMEELARLRARRALAGRE